MSRGPLAGKELEAGLREKPVTQMEWAWCSEEVSGLEIEMQELSEHTWSRALMLNERKKIKEEVSQDWVQCSEVRVPLFPKEETVFLS